ncbi:hypothetical protein F1B92_03710 [Campylobacter sp. FMV-PI01]|uniref:RCK C-terminal domain-containing protein n=1 Tax=Campylobacter portucalensis TaxID=2608384 RepID=A0A6L5WHE4_9BACT|nr:hypothetical protein [Campylobacter portucalensis]MSN96306.1 hypothetical protein [Campylobacter portucalensis]
MKNILIIADGIVAKNFLENIVKLKNVNHNYVIVINDDETLPKNFNIENAKVYKFDPTSKARLEMIVDDNFDRFLVIMDDKFEAKIVYENLRSLNSDEEIYLLDKWNLIEEIEDEHMKFINVNSIISSRLVGFLPDSPVFADNIGLGEGEIMEVKVPIGSSFAYKRLNTILRNSFSIPMIYRHNEIILTKNNTMIFPNDSLLLVGKPAILKDVFLSIKKAKGQFPSPFGINFYLIFDMKNLSYERFKKIYENAIFLNKTITNHKLYIRVINPTISKILDDIKKLNEDDSCEVFIDYNHTKPDMMKVDIKKHEIGMVIAEKNFFETYKKQFYSLKTPVLSIGKGDIKNLKKGVILVNSKSSTSEASVVFDLCGQLGIDIDLYYYDNDINSNKSVLSYYESLSTLFKKDLIINDDKTQNPLQILKHQSDFLHFVPFDKKTLKSKRIKSIFSKDMDELYFMLEDNYQLFIPSYCEI